MTANPEIESDDALMMRFREGDVAAFDALYDRYEAPLFGLCLRLLGKRAEAEDALQDTFVKVVDRRESFEPENRFRSWIFTIARLTCWDRLRADRRAERNLERMPRPDRTEPPESLVLTRTDVDRLLARLPDEQREVLVLYRLYGFSQAEVARIVGGTEASVRQKIYRALRALRVQVERESG